MEITAKGDCPMTLEANQIVEGHEQIANEIEDNFETALILIIMLYLVASTIIIIFISSLFGQARKALSL